MIIRHVRGNPVIYDLRQFVEPREKILTDGTLTEFPEWESRREDRDLRLDRPPVQRVPQVRLPQRRVVRGPGMKTTQFVRTPSGWKMSSLAWEDV